MILPGKTERARAVVRSCLRVIASNHSSLKVALLPQAGRGGPYGPSGWPGRPHGRCSLQLNQKRSESSSTAPTSIAAPWKALASASQVRYRLSRCFHSAR